MPRRKGISHKQRTAQKQQQQQVLQQQKEEERQELTQRTANNEGKKKKTVISNDEPVSNGVQRAANNNQDGGSKYLHKKFKKMAEMEETPEEARPPVNGHPEDASAGRYLCPYCGLLCAKPSVLQKHIRAHTNERPFPCLPCGFSFKTKSNLYKHCRSRAHTLKMEEDGADPSKFPQLPPEGEEDASSDDADSLASAPAPLAAPLAAPGATPISALPGEVGGERAAEPAPRNIYKPKFHPAALHYNASAEKENSERHPGPWPGPWPGPGPDSLQSAPSPGPYNTPSPEFLQRRISKIISENQAIVETSDPLWPKKANQRHNSRSSEHSAPGSPLPPSPSPTGTDSPSSVWPKKFLYRQMSAGAAGAAEQSDANSKLALALLRPKAATPPPPDTPLNLSKPTAARDVREAGYATSNGTLDLTQPHRKRSLADPQPHYQSPQHQPTHHQPHHQPHHPPHHHQPSHHQPPHHQSPHHQPPHHQPPHHQPPLQQTPHHQTLHHQPPHHPTSHHQTSHHQPHHHHQHPHHPALHHQAAHHMKASLHSIHTEQDSAFKRVPSYGVDLHQQSVDGSVIKDILLKSRAAGLTPSAFGAPPGGPPAGPPPHLTYLPYDLAGLHGLPALQGLDDAASPYLSAYQCPNCKVQYRSADTLKKHMMYYCKAENNNQQRPPSGSPMEPPVGYPSSPSRHTSVVPPQPSPGPLLGNTPLVESYNNRDPPPKKRRLDSGGHALEPRSSPGIGFATPSSPMPTTLRSLEELSRCPMRANSLQMFGGQVQILDNAGETTTLRIEPSSRGTPSGLNMSEKSVTPMSVESSRTSTNSSPQQMVVTIAKSGLQTGGGTIVQQVPVSAEGQSGARGADSKSKSPFSASSSVSDASHLVMPFIPHITAPNLAIKGIPTPSHVPFMPYPPLLGDSSLLNPLTSITAFNPLTLAAQPQPPPQTLQPEAQPHPKSEVHPPPPSSSSSPPSSSSVLPRTTTTVTTSVSAPVSYGGGILTIVHGGRAIPHVPGMPGPATQVHSSRVVSAVPALPALPPVAMRPPPKDPVRTKVATTPTAAPATTRTPTPTLTPSKVQSQATILNTSSSPTPSSTATLAPSTPKSTPSSLPASTSSSSTPTSTSAEKRNFHMFSAEAMNREKSEVDARTSNVPSIRVEPVKGQSPQSVQSPTAKEDSGSSHSLRLKRMRSESSTTMSLITQESEEVDDKKAKISISTLMPDASENKSVPNDDHDENKSNNSEAIQGNRFLRPTSLPLKPGTFTPKRHLITPNVLSLVSPETPRPKKSYGQLYLNGHAYTYLGLKCSTRPFFCTLNRLQPTYVPLSPDHSKLSMYSNWKVYDPDPNPCGLAPSQVIALYDSRHRPSEYTVAGVKNTMRLTHSSYWLNRVKKESQTTVDVNEDGNDAPKRIKIFAGGFESYEDYTYVRGRGRGRYVCEECGIRCKKPSMLKKHIRTHTDVRPFTCKHCSFSFKTKGNLTKHMKSKAHYKKCVEMGITPVPTVVDDSYIDEACLARQQALRANRGEDEEAEDSEDNEDEDEDDDDDEEEEDDEEDETDDNVKGRQEREAARSLLSLAQTPHPSPGNDRATEKEAREAGLVAPKGAGCLSTYPYRLSSEHPRRITSSIPGTPTLAAISEHKEREKVSHNTGLARDIHDQGVLVEDSSKPLAELSTGDGHQRYYFPSSRAVGGSSAISDSIKEESEESEAHLSVEATDSVDNASKNKTSSTNSRTSLNLLTLPLSVVSRTPTTPISEILIPVSEPAFLLASLCSTMEKLPVSLATPTDSHQDSALLQTYLRERAVQDARVKQSQYHPRLRKEGSSSNASTPVGTPLTPTTSLPYFTMASQVETVGNTSNAVTLTSASQLISFQTSALETPISRPPPLVWAVQKANKISDIDSKQIVCSVTKGSESPCTVNNGAENAVSPKSPHSPVPVKQESTLSPAKSVVTPTSTHGTSSTKSVIPSNSSRTSSESNATTELGPNTVVKRELKQDSLPPVPFAGDNRTISTQSVITIVSSSASDTFALSVTMPHEEASSAVSSASIGSRLSANSVIVATTGSSSPPLTPSSVSKKPKAEFMPPSSGPAPSYVSVTEDGRSMCTICNKIFSKPSQLRLHVNIHYFERPFRCDACAVSFRTRGHLQKHERSLSHHNKVSMNSTFGTPTTTNPRPYKCDDCKSAFRIHGHLAKHLRSKMHIMKLECVGKLPFGTYAEIERSGVNMNEIDTTDCDNSLESLLALAQKLCEKDPTKLNQWKQPENTASDIDESSDEGEPLIFHGLPFPDVDTGDEDNGALQTNQSESLQHQPPQQQSTPPPLPPPPPPPKHQPSQIHQQKLPPNPSSPVSFLPLPQQAPQASTNRTNTTAAAAAAAAAVVAAASAPAPRGYSGIPGGAPPPGSNGIQSFGASVKKTESQSTDATPFLSSSGALHRESSGVGGSLNYSLSEPWRYNSVNSRLLMLSNNKESLDTKIVNEEVSCDVQEKTVDVRTLGCESLHKTDDVGFGAQSVTAPVLQPPSQG